MAIGVHYRYRFLVHSPTLLSVEDHAGGVGTRPLLDYREGMLRLRKGSTEATGFNELTLDYRALHSILRPGDVLHAELNQHTWTQLWRNGELELQFGYLCSASGLPFEVVNGYDEDGKLHLTSPVGISRLSGGESVRMLGYQVYLDRICGSCLGRSYAADGALGRASYDADWLRETSPLIRIH